jgi:CubicO group peptidase (beta-lactamase class C family)
VNDLYVWDQALFTDKLIPRALLDEMFTPYVSVPDMGRITGFDYGYGWYIGEFQNHRMVFHTGRIEGFSAINSVYPDDNVIVVVLSNQWIGSVNGIVVRLTDILFTDK